MILCLFLRPWYRYDPPKIICPVSAYLYMSFLHSTNVITWANKTLINSGCQHYSAIKLNSLALYHVCLFVCLFVCSFVGDGFVWGHCQRVLENWTHLHFTMFNRVYSCLYTTCWGTSKSHQASHPNTVVRVVVSKLTWFFLQFFFHP
jgi:hypothetical protein